LEALARLARRARRDVGRHHAQVPEAGLAVGPLLVEGFAPQGGAHLVGLAPAVDRHAAVALLRRGLAEPSLVAGREETGGHGGRTGPLVVLGLGSRHELLSGLRRDGTVEERLVCRGARAVGVEAGDAHVDGLGLGWGRANAGALRRGRVRDGGVDVVLALAW